MNTSSSSPISPPPLLNQISSMWYRSNTKLKNPRNFGITKNIPNFLNYKMLLNIFNIVVSKQIQSTIYRIYRANQKKKKLSPTGPKENGVCVYARACMGI